MWKLEAAWVLQCWNRNTMLSYLFQREVGKHIRVKDLRRKRNNRAEGHGQGCTDLLAGAGTSNG